MLNFVIQGYFGIIQTTQDEQGMLDTGRKEDRSKFKRR